MNYQKIVPVFYADCLPEILNFYTNVLSFHAVTIFPSADKPEVLIFDNGENSLMYCKVGPMPRSSGQINIEVDDIHAVLDSLPAEVKPEWGPEAFFYGRTEFGIRDPNEVLVVFTMLTNS